MAMEGSSESREDHECAAGWYSEAVMAAALRVKQNIYKMDLDKPLQPEEDNLQRIYDDDVVGIVVNKSQLHWVAFKVVEQHIWLLDSQLAPRSTTFQAFLEYVRFYRNAFLIRHL